MGTPFPFLIAGIAGILSAQQHGYSPADIESGARLYRANCAVCHGPDGDSIAGVDLRRREYRRAVSDDDLTRLIGRGIPGTAMPPTAFSSPQLWEIVAYVRSMREQPSSGAAAGDPGRGRMLFEGKGACLTCHRVGAQGSRVGPDLSEIGAIRPATFLERSVVAPGENVLPQNRSVRAVTRDGAVITGRRLNEDTHTVQLLDGQERLVSLSKAGLREYTVLNESAMPPYRDKFNHQELTDLLSYLRSLRGNDTP